MILVTGAAGFVGSNFVLDWLAQSDEPVINLDALTYAGNLENLASLDGDARHVFVKGDIGDGELVAKLLAEHQPRAVVNFAAESHVDRSIYGPEDFIQTNIVGTFRLLEAVRAYCDHRNKGWPQGQLEKTAKNEFRFLHVSTDEVYGSLSKDDPAFTETHQYEPNSPYSASKEQITYVTDRPGHDRRYAIDASKIERELGWKPAETFDTGIKKTVQWYLDSQAWVANVTSGAYQNWVGKQYRS